MSTSGRIVGGETPSMETVAGPDHIALGQAGQGPGPGLTPGPIYFLTYRLTTTCRVGQFIGSPVSGSSYSN